MTIIDRIASRFRPRERRAFTLQSLGLLEGVGSAGVDINATSAQQVPAVSAAIDLIAGQIASLPMRIYRRDGAGRTELAEHPVARLLAEPNERASGADLVAWLMRQVLLYGNAILEIVRDDGGAVVELIPHPWPNVTPLLIDHRRLVFDVVETGGSLGGSGARRRLLRGEYVHLRDHSDDGILGVPRLTRCSQAISVARASQDFAASFFRNGLRPSLALHMPHNLTADQMKAITANLNEAHQGPGKAGKVMLLQAGMELKPYSATPEQSELVESRRFSVEEIARIYGVPLIFLQSLQNVNYAAARHAFELLAVQTLAPWCVKIEGTLTRALFSDEARADHSIHIDLSGLTRGDFGARWAAWRIARETGVLTPDEIREAEGYSPMRGGDV